MSSSLCVKLKGSMRDLGLRLPRVWLSTITANRTPGILVWFPLVAISVIFWSVWARFAIPGFGRPTVLAGTLHLGIVFFIGAIDRKHIMQSGGTARVPTCTNVTLVAFSAAFLAFSMLSKVRGDYWSYLQEWFSILRSNDPWAPNTDFNAYGPLFNVLAPLVWLTPLAPKLLFGFAYLVYVIWLVKEFGFHRGLDAFSWPIIIFWLLNPFPWVEIAYYGQFDVLVALASVAAVHSHVRGRDIFAGVFLALGALLKYLPIVILPFLLVNKGRFRLRSFICCAAFVILGLFASALMWGWSTFSPLIFATTRPSFNSIYEVLSMINSPLHRSGEIFRAPHVDVSTFSASQSFNWLEKPLELLVGSGVLIWCVARQTGLAISAPLAILVALLFYREGFINYQMVLFFLLSYFASSEWQRLKMHCVLAPLLVGYFAFLAVIDIAIVLGLEGYSQYSLIIVLLRFLLGVALMATLIQFSASTPPPPMRRLHEVT